MGTIFAQGVKQGDLVDLLVLIKTNWNAILTKLDADTGVADTDYNALQALTMPAGISTTETKGIRDQGQIVTFLDNFITKFNAVLAKLDLDGTVTDTNFASLLALTDVVGAEKDAIHNAGMDQGAMVKMLDLIIAGIAALTAKLDLDGTVNGTNYASLWNVADTVNSTGGSTVLR